MKKWGAIQFYLAALGICLVATSPVQASTDLATSAWEFGDPITFFDDRVQWDVEMRERFTFVEDWVDFNENFDLRDDVALQQRLRLGLRVSPYEFLDIYGQLQDSRTFFDEPAGPNFNRELTTHNNAIDLHQGFVHLRPQPGIPFGIKVGRQKLSFGDERLIGANEWSNNARVFDAVQLTFDQADYQIHAFSGWVVIPEAKEVDSPDTEDLISGIYINSNWIPGITTEPYVLYRRKTDVDVNSSLSSAENQRSGNNAPAGDIVTTGVRLESKPEEFGSIDFRVEVALQAGSIRNPKGFGAGVAGNPVNTGRQDHIAGAVHAQIGYTAETLPLKPRFFGEFNYASGDDDPNDDIDSTFQPLYPTPHRFHGQLDRFAWMNMFEFAVGAEARVLPNWDVSLSYHVFLVAETSDPLRVGSQGALGGVGRYGNALNSNPSPFAGSELNLRSRYHLNRWASFEFGYAHFFTGNYIEDTAPLLNGTRESDDADFAYLQLSILL
ncbi:MAG: alginate export family protein [Verrucomicrobiota bacterium]